MEKAKQAVSDFMRKSGHHETEVHERVAPAVEHKTINKTEREERQVAVDREVHQDHYHTSVQPIQDREVLPEEHHHNFVPVEHRTHDHRDHEKTQHHLQTEAAQFKDQVVRGDTHHTLQEAPSVAGEHVHHHIHETIQPVVQKETIEPHVVHTVVPVHEVHQNAAQHHAASALPAVSMTDFKKQGGVLGGREERIDHFSGEPRSLEHALGGHQHQSGEGLTGHHSTSTTGHHTGADGLTGTHSTSATGHHHGAGAAAGVAGASAMSHNDGLSKHSTDSSTTHKKPSLMDRLNPMKDSDHDGKKGLMD